MSHAESIDSVAFSVAIYRLSHQSTHLDFESNRFSQFLRKNESIQSYRLSRIESYTSLLGSYYIRRCQEHTYGEFWAKKSTDAVKSNVSGGGDWNQNTYHMTKAAHLWRRARIRRYCGDVRCGGSPIVPGLTGREAGIARARLPVPAGGCSDLWSRAAWQ